MRIKCYSDIQLNNKYDNFAVDYIKKYHKSLTKETEIDGKTIFGVIAFENQERGPGMIMMYKEINENKQEFYLNIEYLDSINTRLSSGNSSVKI